MLMLIPGYPAIQSPISATIDFSAMFKGIGEISSLVPYQIY
jgi:hypothetical protein